MARALLLARVSFRNSYIVLYFFHSTAEFVEKSGVLTSWFIEFEQIECVLEHVAETAMIF